MVELQSVDMGFGSVTFAQLNPETPTTTERQGNTTVNYVGSPGRAPYCEVSYMLTASYKTEDDAFSNIFHWTVRLPGKSASAPYFEAEAEGARLIAPMLRAVADGIEKRVADYDESRREERGEV
jgi:hypothetical protein